MSALMEQQQDFLRDLNQFITGRRVTQFLELRIPKPESLKPHRIPIQARDGDGAQPQVVEGGAQDQNA